MKTLIAYSTTLGCTERCASKLKEDIGEGVEMIQISSRKKYDLREYDTIIIGGSIHEGRIQQSVRHFCTSNLQVLLQKQVGLFVCCMDQDDNEKEMIEQAFPPQLLESAGQRILRGRIEYQKDESAPEDHDPESCPAPERA